MGIRTWLARCATLIDRTRPERRAQQTSSQARQARSSLQHRLSPHLMRDIGLHDGGLHDGGLHDGGTDDG